MKKILRKVLPLLLSVPLLGGCATFHSDESEKSEFVGTYKLKTITKKHNQNEDPYDYKAEIGAEAYFTLDINGYVYYAYKDNNTPLSVKQAYAIFTRDDEDENLYKSIKIQDGKTSCYMWEKEVGCMDEPTMGFQNSGKKSWFSGKPKDLKQGFAYTIHYADGSKWTTSYHEVKYQYVYYEKISSDGTLRNLNNILGTNYKFDRPIELTNVHGFYAYSAQEFVMENNDYLFVRDYVLTTIGKEIENTHSIDLMLSREKYRRILHDATLDLYALANKGQTSISEIVDIIIDCYNKIVDKLNEEDETFNISKIVDETKINELKDEMKTLVIQYNSCADDGSVESEEKIKTAISLVLDIKKQNIAFGYSDSVKTQISTYENDEYEYQIVDMESYNNGKATLYYSEKANPGLKISTANIVFIENEGYFKTVELTVLGKKYYCYNWNSIGLGYIFTDNVVTSEDDKYTSQSFYQCCEAGHTLEEAMEAIGVRK